MERIFPNLFRFTDEPYRRGRRFTYLLKRKQGNLLLTCQDGSVRDHFKDIEKLGGIDTQFINHNHDMGGELHEAIHKRFGAKLFHHKAEKKKVEAKTKCPHEEFGDDGLQVGSDFEAIYFPSCTAGLSLYRWRHQGVHFLFTSHVIKMVQGDWHVSLHMKKSPPGLGPQFAQIAKLPVDYVLPNVCAYGQEEYHRFNDFTRKSFGTALRARLRVKD